MVYHQEITRNTNGLAKDTQIDNKNVFKYPRSWKPAHETAVPLDDKGVEVAFEDKAAAENEIYFLCNIFFSC